MVYFQQQQNSWICMVFVVIIFLVCGYANKYQLTVTVWFKILFLKKSILRTLNVIINSELSKVFLLHQ